MWIVYVILGLLVLVALYDRFIQRKHQLLINYPLIGRFRFFFEAVREPFRQYFGDEEFYESKDKIDWVYDNANNKQGFISFSPSQPLPNPKFIIKHSNSPLNNDEVCPNFSVTFGEDKKYPFITRSIIARSAMSDGAISPEGTRAFVKGAYEGHFPINSGEGSITTNFFMTYKVKGDEKFLECIHVSKKDKQIYNLIKTFSNRYIALNYLKNKLLDKDMEDTYMFDFDKKIFFRVNWDVPFEDFPREVPDTLPDIIYQISSGLYGARDKDGNFSEDRYKKTMSFCKMTEIKLAQGAKQTGGKLVGKKVTPAIAYYRGVEPYKDLYSPNRFPFANSIKELFDFIARLQELSQKPVGIKIVISSKTSFLEFVQEIKYRKENNISGIPDFISIDGGDGGSATAPLYLMDRVGLHIKDAIFIADTLLKEYGVRDKVKLIASSKILTPDDVVIALCLGADFVQIARGFMLSGGCIRARMCSGEGSHQCPVGLATQDKNRRKSYLVYKQAERIKNYHNNLLKGVRTIMGVMGVKDVEKLNSCMISFIDRNGFIYENVNRYMDQKIN
jgi:glutamate synthase domain-containing protein 2